MVPPPRNANNSGIAEYPWTGPSALVMQVSFVFSSIICNALIFNDVEEPYYLDFQNKKFLQY